MAQGRITTGRDVRENCEIQDDMVIVQQFLELQFAFNKNQIHQFWSKSTLQNWSVPLGEKETF